MRGLSYEYLLGQRICVGQREAMAARALEMLGNGGKIATVNPIMLREAMKNEKLSLALSESVNLPDGVGVSLVLAMRGKRSKTLPGVELGELLLEAGEVSFVIFGGEAGVAEAAAKNLCLRHAGAHSLACFCGYNYNKEEIIRSLEASPPDLMFVCLGSPKQEIMIRELYPHSPKTLFVGLGGSADVYAGRVKRAPRFFRRLKLEWLWRILNSPQRIKKLPMMFGFLFFSILEVFRVKTYKKALKNPQKDE